MLELMRLMPRRVRMISFTLGVQLFFTQIGIMMYRSIQMHEPESSIPNLTHLLADYMSDIYREITPALPMVIVITIGVVVLAQILARFLVSGPYVHELHKWVRKHPIKSAFNVILIVGLAVSLSVLRNSYLGGLLGGLCVSGFVYQVLQPWINWVYTWGESEQGA